jgi:hypothetical protein
MVTVLLFAKYTNFSLLQEEAQMYGIDWDGPIPDHEDEVDWVTVPDCRCPLSAEDYDDLEHAISPTAASSNYGIDLYLSVVRFVEDKLSDYQ